MGPASLCQWCFFDCGGRRQRATQAASSASRAVASVRKLGKRRIPGCRLCLLSTPGRLCPLRIRGINYKPPCSLPLFLAKRERNPLALPSLDMYLPGCVCGYHLDKTHFDEEHHKHVPRGYVDETLRTQRPAATFVDESYGSPKNTRDRRRLLTSNYYITSTPA